MNMSALGTTCNHAKIITSPLVRMLTNNFKSGHMYHEWQCFSSITFIYWDLQVASPSQPTVHQSGCWSAIRTWILFLRMVRQPSQWVLCPWVATLTSNIHYQQVLHYSVVKSCEITILVCWITRGTAGETNPSYYLVLGPHKRRLVPSLLQSQFRPDRINGFNW